MEFRLSTDSLVGLSKGRTVRLFSHGLTPNGAQERVAAVSVSPWKVGLERDDGKPSVPTRLDGCLEQRVA
jgi:hypothetical protein